MLLLEVLDLTDSSVTNDGLMYLAHFPKNVVYLNAV